nr:hypothetical protein [Tanacetum cinerariifolium]
TALNGPDGYIPLYLSLFTIGNLCFPLDVFCLDVFELFYCHFSLLNPFGVSRVTTFIVACKTYGGVSTMPFFRSFLNIGPAGHWLTFQKWPGHGIHQIFDNFMTNIPIWKSEFIFVKETLIFDARSALITYFCHGLGTFAYPTEPFDEVLRSHLACHTFKAQTFLEPILYLAGLEGATLIKLSAAASSSKHESKKRKQEGPKRTSTRGSVPPPTATAPKGIRKHSRFPRIFFSHNVLSSLHCPILKCKLDSLCLHDLANVYDIHALQLAVVRNMLKNESRVVSSDYSKLKDDFIFLRSKNILLERKMSKLEDKLSKAQKSQDVEGSQVVKSLTLENAWIFKELSTLQERLSQRCQDLEAERDFLLSNESEEITDLSLKLKIADLKRVELVRDLIPLAVKKLFASEHFNRALGDLEQKSITYGRSHALDEVHDMGDS